MPTEAVEPKSAKDLPETGRDTDYDDPTSVVDPMDDPYFL